MSEGADHPTQTCEIRMKDKRLPDLAGLSEHLREMRLGASLGGVEATVVGMVAKDGPLVMELSETGERLSLAPLRAKIQWSLETRQEHPMTRREQSALDRLRREPERGTRRFEVVGPLVEENSRVHLEVRSFRRLPDDPR